LTRSRQLKIDSAETGFEVQQGDKLVPILFLLVLGVFARNPNLSKASKHLTGTRFKMINKILDSIFHLVRKDRMIDEYERALIRWKKGIVGSKHAYFELSSFEMLMVLHELRPADMKICLLLFTFGCLIIGAVVYLVDVILKPNIAHSFNSPLLLKWSYDG
jgi:hypothetical protein